MCDDGIIHCVVAGFQHGGNGFHAKVVIGCDHSADAHQKRAMGGKLVEHGHATPSFFNEKYPVQMLLPGRQGND